MITELMAIDPGNVESAYVHYSPNRRKLIAFGKMPNNYMVHVVEANRRLPLVIEYPHPRGQPMYTQLVETIMWIGRFWAAYGKDSWVRMDRTEIKKLLTGKTSTKDKNVRAALISRYTPNGGGKTPEIGTKKKPGPLYGVSKDVWAALAVAVAYSIEQGLEPIVPSTRGQRVC